MITPRYLFQRTFLFAILAPILALCLYSFSINANAAEFSVNDTNDAVDANPGDGICATSSGGCSLRAAIQEANALPNEDFIAVPAGVFTLTVGSNSIYQPQKRQ